jgi:bud site selection protein 31
MPAIRHSSKRKPPPAGFSDIETDLLIFSNKMKDAENTTTSNGPRAAALWPIFQISHQRSRYVYELYYEKEGISKELYEWLLKNGYADGGLIAKWKREGYEKVCFLALRCSLTARFLCLSVIKFRTDIWRLVVLSTMYSDQGDELQLYLHLSSAESAAQGGSECGVCQLWM